ncbi:phage tail protein [Flavobacterium aquicola]|uniref:Microcystin-dependent protein n=1 Tax=Flavobacterium aquicola TaxID=1682742 RepID=A0A3E0DWQ4_9FLAO|nr:tail fiber protein [Flavobacterium aquicola]REG90478.1 microcystin-dependent protein [Flavobacterium aquicola]
MFVQPFIATVTVFAGNYAPVSWMFCQGQLLSIAEYNVLYALIGTTYGGDGQETFGLPDFRGRRPIHIGQGPGMSKYVLGQIGGSETTTLLTTNLPIHNHLTPVLTGTPQGSTDTTGVDTPTNATVPASGTTQYGSPAGKSAMGSYTGNAITQPGGGNSSPIETISPYLAMNYIIAVEGIFPSRN